MITDTRELPDGHLIETDLCIVGAGVAGVTLALALRDAPFRVLIVESGGLQPDKEAQGLLWGRNTGHRYYGLDTSRCTGIGGSSHKWLLELPDMRLGARIHPLEPIDFEVRPWVPHSGWPISYDAMQPYYEAAHGYCTSNPFSYRAGDWTNADDTPLLPLPGRHVTSTVFHFTDRDAFIQRPWKRLQSAHDLNLLSHAVALRIETNEAVNQATSLQLVSHGERRLTVAAKRFVLAAGALETVRLLLISDHQQRAGLGNQNDLVGRFFMEHPHVWSGKYNPAPHVTARELSFYHLHTAGQSAILGKLATTASAQREARLLNHCVSLHPRAKRAPANLVPEWPIDNWPLLNSFAYRGDWDTEINADAATDLEGDSKPDALWKRCRRGAKELRSFGRHFGHRLAAELTGRQGAEQLVYTLNHMSEQVPNPDSRVTLARELDRFGRRRIELDWRLTSLDLESIIRSQQLVDMELQQAGLGYLSIEDDPGRLDHQIHGGWHHMGTTRMHTDPRHGVVDPNCCVHGIPNLFIAGPSVFPTSGYANPVLTIVALSLRLADYLKGASAQATSHRRNRVAEPSRRPGGSP